MEQDIKLVRMGGKGRAQDKENKQTLAATPVVDEAETELRVASIEIPALKQLNNTHHLIRPRDHHRGRRGAIVEKT